MDPTATESQVVGSLGHELFHAYQHENGQDPYSVNAEIGAYLFGETLKFSLGYGSTTLGTTTEEGQIYENAMNTLMFGDKFNLQEYYKAIDNFKAGSKGNSTGIYKNHPIYKPDENPLIKKFFPLIK